MSASLPSDHNPRTKALHESLPVAVRQPQVERGSTEDTAIRLGTFYKTSAEFWMNLQMTYDLRNVEKALPASVRKSIEDNRSVLA